MAVEFAGVRGKILRATDQPLRAAVRAVHDPVAAVEAHRVVHPREALRRVLVPAVSDPAVHLLQHRRAEVVPLARG